MGESGFEALQAMVFGKAILEASGCEQTARAAYSSCLLSAYNWEVAGLQIGRHLDHSTRAVVNPSSGNSECSSEVGRDREKGGAEC